ncbi:phosphoribosyltransferase family protein [Virgibacillus sp. 179-BFC.A HS]|uniref:Phosphoribosyltransferase family protein n=1 Tax=Tigheibacillus jepli TaxID=3035914 RepID=A0ABU5CF62_9BACI|nr:phosphoribosyltransferase family protein [Virgibacillus sp. 179-BFC.A HS]MDY0404974.1 phosphoribosyltransferase family protein [Virgibacillus sp. 179-BFC.A HS]
METYELQVAGLTRQLQIVQIKPGLQIASFIILGDTELVTAAAMLLAKRLPPADILITAEAKGIPFVYELAKELGHKQYVVARKNVQAYMEKPLISEVSSITTRKRQFLCLDTADAALLEGKRIALVDDIISTGESMHALEQLVHKANGEIVAKASILAEGNAAKRNDIIYLQHVPVFTD